MTEKYDIERIRELIIYGKTYREIAEELNISYDTIKALVSVIEIPDWMYEIREDNLMQCMELWYQGYTISQISQYIGVGINLVNQYCLTLHGRGLIPEYNGFIDDLKEWNNLNKDVLLFYHGLVKR